MPDKKTVDANIEVVQPKKANTSKTQPNPGTGPEKSQRSWVWVHFKVHNDKHVQCQVATKKTRGDICLTLLKIDDMAVQNLCGTAQRGYRSSLQIPVSNSYGFNTSLHFTDEEYTQRTSDVQFTSTHSGCRRDGQKTFEILDACLRETGYNLCYDT
ncbi:hypothetical protein PSTT_16412 [Puccinia striiformis]|uniref:Uncharacterized protein n=1 Tax=Puccinia striiformis TaxID=27350 RepID=A0A2S4UD83_9BASI|nr:hypothetical protein PSTT_16412 [Puccinia striiformis]